MSNEHENQTTEDRGQMEERSWWAYIPDVCEAGVVVDAYTLEEAVVEAQRELLEAPWTYPLRRDRERPIELFLYELGKLTIHHLPREEEN